MWLKGYHYMDDRNKSILSLGWCQWKGIITSSGENILVCKHRSAVFITFYSTCVSKKISWWGGGAVWDAEKKSLIFLVRQNFCNNYIFIKISFMAECSVLPSTRCFSHVSQRYLATGSENQNLSSKTCLHFQSYISLLFCVSNWEMYTGHSSKTLKSSMLFSETSNEKKNCCI